jgi:hypothetical protein
MRPSTVTVTGVTTSPWLPMDPYVNSVYPGVFVKPGAGATITVEVTADNIFDPAVTPIAMATGIAALTGLTTNVATGLTFAARGIRMNQTVGARQSSMTVVTAGIG